MGDIESQLDSILILGTPPEERRTLNTFNKTTPALWSSLLSRALLIFVAVTWLGVAESQAAAPKTQGVELADPATLRLARAFRSAGDYRSAIPLYRKLLTRRDAAPGLDLELGDTLLDADLVDDAIGVYGAIPADGENAARAQLGLARAQLRLNQPARALEHAERAAALAPDDERVLVGLGVALDRAGRHPDAQARYRAALAREPRSIMARTNLALSLALSGRFDEALGLLEPIARSADATARDRQNLAFVYGLKGDRDNALALGRMDLDEAAAQANLKFFDFVRTATK